MVYESDQIKLSPYLVRYKKLRPFCVWHYCPACKSLHGYAVDKPFENGAQWKWNGDVEKPTFTPSMNINAGTKYTCHYFLTDGKIQYLSDCGHALAGQTIDLPKIPEDALF